MGEHAEKLLEETAAMRAPLSADAPVGTDIALEPEFEAIKNEIEKLTSLDGGAVDWGSVVRGAEDLLATRTKDLRLAVWMTVGATHESGWRGLARSLAVCRAYVLELWEPVFPTRAKARSNIMGWLAELAGPLMQQLEVRLDDGDDVRAVAEIVTDLDREMAEKLGDAFGGIRGLVNASKARVKDIPLPPPPKLPTPPPPPPAADDAPAAPVARVVAATPGGVVLSTNAADSDATTRTAATAIVALARSIAMAEPARAWAYSLHRKGIWLRVESVPSALDDAPDPALRERLATLIGESRWIELVFAGEEASARHPLWLDPHRFVAMALERLGSAFNEAREVVGREASDFARRHGARFADARFADGTLVASIETTAWLETESKRWLRATETDIARDEDRELSLRFADARHLVAAGRHAEGIAIAMQLARRGSDPRERFRSSLDVARLAAEAGAYDVARPILESLVTQVEAHALETWEPALAARLYAGLYRCLPGDAPERAKAFETLCRIDPGRALRAQGRGLTGNPGVAAIARPSAVAFSPPVVTAPAPPASSPASSPPAAPAESNGAAAPAAPAEPSAWADDWD